MHETALAKDILAEVLRQAEARGANKILRVHGWIAETEALQPDSLSFHFAAHARDTIAEGASLQLKLTHVQARCLDCGETYLPEHHLTLCPSCGSTEGQLLGDTGLGIDKIDVE